MNQRNYLPLTFFFLVGLFFLTLSCPTLSSATESLRVAVNGPALQRLDGLDRHYDLSFLWFDRLAIGELSLVHDPLLPKRYRALLEARTLGVAAWLTGERVQRYETLMEMTSQGRFVPLEYRIMIHKKKGGKVIEQSKLYTFDAATRTIKLTRYKEGKEGKEDPVKMVEDHFPIDFLTAGFNFISGVDGPIRSGARKEIVTISNKGVEKIVIEVLRAEDWPEIPFFPKGKGTLLKIILPPDILDTSGGAVYAMLDEKFLPQRVIVENVLGMGDVRGDLRP